MSFTISPFHILAFLFVFACFIALQIYLSKQKSRMLGLILPIACFLPALLVTIAAADFSFTATGSYSQLTYTRLGETQTVKFDTSEEMQAYMDSLDENSEIQDFSTVTANGNKAQYAWTVVVLFFVASIPAVVLLCTGSASVDKYFDGSNTARSIQTAKVYSSSSSGRYAESYHIVTGHHNGTEYYSANISF